MSNDNWPYWSFEYNNAREFRAKKREEVREALKALDELRIACVYTPAQDQILNAIKNLEDAKYLMSVKQWKR